MIVKKVWMRLFIIGLVGLVLVGIFSVAMNIYEKKQLEQERYEQGKKLEQEREEQEKQVEKARKQQESERLAEQAIQEAQQKLAQELTPKALYDLFGVVGNAANCIKIDKKQLVTKWYDKYFKYNGGKFYSIFFQVQELNEKGDLLNSCRICTPELSVITYKLTDKKWLVYSKKRQLQTYDADVHDLGEWGELRSFANAVVYTLSNHSIVIGIDSESGNNGEFESFKVLFAFNKKGWQYLGAIILASENSGYCDEMTIDCFYDYKGTMSFLPVSTKAVFPDVIVKKTGIYRNKDKIILPAKDDRYHFDGKQYVMVTPQPVAVLAPFNSNRAIA
jgi:hypothetical protein